VKLVVFRDRSGNLALGLVLGAVEAGHDLSRYQQLPPLR
jgi:hypothetical protein